MHDAVKHCQVLTGFAQTPNNVAASCYTTWSMDGGYKPRKQTMYINVRVDYSSPRMPINSFFFVPL